MSAGSQDPAAEPPRPLLSKGRALCSGAPLQTSTRVAQLSASVRKQLKEEMCPELMVSGFHGYWALLFLDHTAAHHHGGQDVPEQSCSPHYSQERKQG